MVKAKSQENDLCSNVLNGHEQGKTRFVKDKEKYFALVELKDDKRLDKSFSFVDR